MRGRLATGPPRRAGALVRAAAAVQRSGAPHRPAGGTRVQQLAARRGARELRRLAQGRAGPAGFADRHLGARSRGAGRRGAGRRSRALQRDRRVAALGIARSRDRARRAAGDSGGRSRHRRLRTAPLARARGADRRAGRRRAAALLRRGGADRRDRLDRHGGHLPQVALRQGRRRRLPQHPARQSAVPAIHRAICVRCRSTIRRTSSSTSRPARSRTSRAVCRSKRWPRAARTRCATDRSSRSACAIRAPARRRTRSCNCATKTPAGNR